jgi:hypothetical protein
MRRPQLPQRMDSSITSSPRQLALLALGVVFGDIGTSPLYAFRTALAISPETLFDAASHCATRLRTKRSTRTHSPKTGRTSQFRNRANCFRRSSAPVICFQPF